MCIKTYRQVILNNTHWEEATKRVNRSKIFNGSHRKKEGTQVGYLGEVVFEEFLKQSEVDFVNETHKTTHDYLVNNSISLDVKTKDRTVEPQKHFDNSVPLYNHEHQRPDYYYFISLLRNKLDNSDDIKRFTHAFIVGGIDIATLERHGKYWEKDQVDPSNGTKFWTDCINVNMMQLIDNHEMITIFDKKYEYGTQLQLAM